MVFCRYLRDGEFYSQTSASQDINGWNVVTVLSLINRDVYAKDEETLGWACGNPPPSFFEMWGWISWVSTELVLSKIPLSSAGLSWEFWNGKIFDVLETEIHKIELRLC